MNDASSFFQMRPDDPLIQGPQSRDRAQPDRLFYATGVMLNQDDFWAEQLYHRGRLARCLAYLNGSGTLAGLKVRWAPPITTGDQPVPEELVVEPGLAIDRFGRLIEIPRPVCIRLNRWFDTQSPKALFGAFHQLPANTSISREISGEQAGVVADVFVRFVACPRGYTPAFASGPYDATDATVPARLRDGFEFSLVLRTESTESLPGKLPQSRWENMSEPREVQNRILDAWMADEAIWDDSGRLRPLPEHASGQDFSEVFLARLLLPATKKGNTIERLTDLPVKVDNHSRAFVYPTSAIARFFNAALT